MMMIDKLYDQLPTVVFIVFLGIMILGIIVGVSK